MSRGARKAAVGDALANGGAAGGGPGRRPAAPRSGIARWVHGPDLRIALFILVVCTLLYYLTTRFEAAPALLGQNLPAQWFPRLLLGAIAVMTLLLPFEHLLAPGGRARLDEERKARIEPMAVLTALLLVAVVVALPLLGTFLTMIAVAVLLPLLWGERRWRRLVLFGTLFPLAVMLVFTFALQVYLEPGTFGSYLPWAR